MQVSIVSNRLQIFRENEVIELECPIKVTKSHLTLKEVEEIEKLEKEVGSILIER